MFARRPIVATDVGEVRSALDDGRAGALVAPEDPAALAAAIDALLTDPDRARALAARARDRAIAEYDLPGMVRRYGSIYDELLPIDRIRFTTHPAESGNLNEGTYP
jgi:glycosyltransferase involved in cell wall biosynthesis